MVKYLRQGYEIRRYNHYTMQRPFLLVFNCVYLLLKILVSGVNGNIKIIVVWFFIQSL